MDTANQINEQRAALAFSKQSAVFDELYQSNTIIQYKRDRVRKHLQSILSQHAFILELNAGTGDDAIWLAELGHRVHATDIAPGMQQMLERKVKLAAVGDRISNELRSFTDLENLQSKGPYDLIFSNFAGLNCTPEIEKVIDSFSPLLKQGGMVTLVLLPKFCLWEFSLLLKGRFKTATRRFFARDGRTARVENEYFKCWYYNPLDIIRLSKKSFDVLAIEGLCSFVPPSYMEGFAEKHSKLYAKLVGLEERHRLSWPWRSIGDYFIITLRKK